MSDALANIFTDWMIRRLEKRALTSPNAEFRYRVLSQSVGTIQHPLAEPTDQLSSSTSAPTSEPYAQVRARWNRWVATAAACGLFEQPHGSELKSRLTGIDDDGFRSALAECMVSWVLTAELNLKIQPRPSGRDRRVLEFAAGTSQGEVNFEVKSPRLSRWGRPRLAPEVASATFASYWAAVSMGAALRAANRQFVHSQQNILIIALPNLGETATSGTAQWALLRALYGGGVPASQTQNTSASTLQGDFLKRPDGKPRFTRISAAICLEEVCNPSRLEALLLHNPHSDKPVSAEIFLNWKQLIAHNGDLHLIDRVEPNNATRLLRREFHS